MDFGAPWGAQKSPIFMKNERVEVSFCTFVANLGSLGSLWGNFWSLDLIFNDFRLISHRFFTSFGPQFLLISGLGFASDLVKLSVHWTSRTAMQQHSRTARQQDQMTRPGGMREAIKLRKASISEPMTSGERPGAPNPFKTIVFVKKNIDFGARDIRGASGKRPGSARRGGDEKVWYLPL